MAIKGIGVDICSITRIEKVLASHPQKFIDRVLVHEEKSSSHSAREIAKYFAAKEAVAKALGCGIGEALSFQDITIHRGLNKPPMAKLTAGKFNGNIHLSLSDEEETIVAFAMAESE